MIESHNTLLRLFFFWSKHFTETWVVKHEIFTVVESVELTHWEENYGPEVNFGVVPPPCQIQPICQENHCPHTGAVDHCVFFTIQLQQFNAIIQSHWWDIDSTKWEFYKAHSTTLICITQHKYGPFEPKKKKKARVLINSNPQHFFQLNMSIFNVKPRFANFPTNLFIKVKIYFGLFLA